MLQAAISVVQASQPAEQRPERIVSLHLCADQYLLSLADPEQIVALGPYAHNADISFQAERARHWPSLEATAEEVLALKPDLVLAAAFTNPSTLEALRRLGHRVMRLQHVQTIKDQRRQIMEVAAAIGHPERGSVLAEEISRAFDTLGRESRAAGNRVLYYHRRGYVSGPDNLAGELLSQAGFVNAASDIGIDDTGQASLETVIVARPDYLVLTHRHSRALDQGSSLVNHPALRRLLGEDRRIYLPMPLVVCPGAPFLEAIRVLRSELVRLNLAASDVPRH